MAFTKIVSPGIDTTGSYTVRDLNAVGVVTASAFSGPLTGNATGLTGTPDIAVANITATGNVSIGGTLTYEDVTNIDSVGIITARSGIHVTGGNVGIGSDNPQTKLDLLVGGSSGGVNIHNNATGSAFYQLSTTANSYKVESIGSDLRIYNNTASSEPLRITSSGVVGINTDASGNGSGGKLVVGGRIQSNAGGYWFAGANGAEDGWHVQDSGGNLVVVESGVAERLRITSAGKIGINTASPRAVLDIEGNAENATLMLHSNDANANLQFSDNTGGARILNYGGDLAFRTGTNAHVFGTGDSEALRITSGGEVGIATDNPTFGQSTPVSTYNPKLGVEGSIIIGNLSTTASDRSELQFYRRAGTYSQPVDTHDMGRIAWYGSSNDSNNANLAWSIGVTPDGGSWTSGSNRKGYMTFNNHNGEQVRVNSSGTLIVDAGGEAQDIKIISHSGGGGHGKIYLRGNASNESSSIQLNHYGHADYHISAGRVANGLFSITRTQDGTDGIIMNANGNVGIKNTGTSSKLHIGDLVSDVTNDINTTHTSLIIKQTNNDNKSGIYIERSGERKGYYMWLNPGGGAGDGLTFTRNNAGTKSDALILDRDANLWGGGTFYPLSDNSYDLGSTSNRWRNVYTTDLQLSNEGSQNDVDGTWGSYTIQEGEDELFLINRRNGKKYKFNLTEVN